MNREKRKELRKLNTELRSALKRIKHMKWEESADYRARCPNGTNHYPRSWSMFDDAETGLKEAITWIERIEQASPGWTLSVYDTHRKVAV